MNRNPQTGALEPFDFEHLLLSVPELKQFDTAIDTFQFPEIIGTLAGDNTVFIVVGEGTEHQVMAKLKMMLG